MKKRPKVLNSTTVRYKLDCGWIYITVTVDKDNLPQEIFASLGKAGGCASAQTEALGSTISIALRNGVPVTDFIHRLQTIQCGHKGISDGIETLSCADAIAKALKEGLTNGYIKEFKEQDTGNESSTRRRKDKSKAVGKKRTEGKTKAK